VNINSNSNSFHFLNDIHNKNQLKNREKFVKK